MLILNANLVTWERPNRILENYGLRIAEGKIAEIAPVDVLREKYPAEEIENAHSQWVMPGNLCAHTHFYGAFARGLAIPGQPAKRFTQILENLWWPLDRSLTIVDVRASALVCLVDAIKHGTTTLIDHHASPNAIEGSLETIAEAVLQAGTKAILCYEVTDRNGKDGAVEGIKENIAFAQRVNSGGYPAGQIGAMFGLHAGLTLSDDTLTACKQAAPDGLGFHIHAAESQADQDDSMDRRGERVVDRLNRLGILGPNTILAHGVHLDAREIEQLAETQTWLTHQPRSNMNNAVGVAQVEAMLRMGVKVGLGNDGFSNAMWEEWKACYLVHKLNHSDPRRMTADVIVQMAVINNRELVKRILPDAEVGILKVGADADLIFVDYLPFTDVTEGNLPWHIVFGMQESMITSTMVHGKFLMKDRKLTTLDEEKIAFDAKKLSHKVWERFNWISQERMNR